jgi:hypothetical protein
MAARLLLYVSLAFSLLGFTNGHATMVFPPPRNAVDRDLAPWNAPMDPKWDHHVDTPICPYSNGSLTLDNGQSCFWYSHGCTIFCDKCDGVTARGKDTCPEKQKPKATICDPRLRTVNRKAACGSHADSYYYNPWRAPGSAPVFDACGMAGGGVYRGWTSAGVQYRNTTHARQGDKGSEVLPPRDTGIVWRAGSIVEVSWTMRTNHGGGYQWRIANADEPLTEANFQKTPLPFAGKPSLRWNGQSGRQLWFNGTCLGRDHPRELDMGHESPSTGGLCERPQLMGCIPCTVLRPTCTCRWRLRRSLLRLVWTRQP